MLNKIVFNIVKYVRRKEISAGKEYPIDFEQSDIEIIKKVRQYTMTSPERIVALIKGIQYIVKNNIPGDIVECGVWKGGSMMAAALALIAMKDTDRNLYLFDTFEGMTEPTKDDISCKGDRALDLLKKNEKDEESYIWAYSPLEKVKSNLLSIGYDFRKIHFIKGKVEETIPEKAPEKISLLRLDTDWYKSTLHELAHLYPRLSPGGIIIIDDYGHWHGARKATEEFIKNNNIRLFLSRIDYTGKIGVKQ
ncbi:MAG: macrocin O-methyltransferase [Nitrospirae bacterium RBG_13_39_12]|nr:MAG: macrocin O-methyltransferase [Nitrospirae bacterium RBG_13_39_12]